jgi:hypothetical protein
MTLKMLKPGAWENRSGRETMQMRKVARRSHQRS